MLRISTKSLMTWSMARSRADACSVWVQTLSTVSLRFDFYRGFTCGEALIHCTYRTVAQTCPEVVDHCFVVPVFHKGFCFGFHWSLQRSRCNTRGPLSICYSQLLEERQLHHRAEVTQCQVVPWWARWVSQSQTASTWAIQSRCVAKSAAESVCPPESKRMPQDGHSHTFPREIIFPTPHYFSGFRVRCKMVCIFLQPKL